MESRLPLAPSPVGFAGAGQADAGNECRRLWRRFLFPAVALAAAAMSFAQAQAPVLDSLRPRSAGPGATIRVVAAGRFLGAEVEVVPDFPGSFKVLSTTSSTRCQFLATIRPDARAGLYRFRVRTPAGISNSVLFHVGAGPEFNETESEPDAVEHLNDRPENAQAVRQTPAVINGTLSPADRDYYRVYGKGGEKRSFELEKQLDLAGALSLRILAPDGTALAHANGPAALNRPLTVRFPTEAYYLVEVAADGDTAGEVYYRLRMQAPRENRR